MENRQKELKEIYKSELKKAWNNDEKMIIFCSKEAAYIIEYKGGLYKIDKPSIKKDFCFGYGYCGISTQEDQDAASNAAETARKSEAYFIDENMQDINRRIKQLEDIKKNMQLEWLGENHPQYLLKSGIHYYSQTEDCRLRSYDIIDVYRTNKDIKDLNILEVDFIDELLKGYEIVKSDFEKRLKTYLKRYGLTKVNSWSYLVD